MALTIVGYSLYRADSTHCLVSERVSTLVESQVIDQLRELAEEAAKLQELVGHFRIKAC